MTRDVSPGVRGPSVSPDDLRVHQRSEGPLAVAVPSPVHGGSQGGGPRRGVEGR